MIQRLCADVNWAFAHMCPTCILLIHQMQSCLPPVENISTMEQQKHLAMWVCGTHAITGWLLQYMLLPTKSWAYPQWSNDCVIKHHTCWILSVCVWQGAKCLSAQRSRWPWQRPRSNDGLETRQICSWPRHNLVMKDLLSYMERCSVTQCTCATCWPYLWRASAVGATSNQQREYTKPWAQEWGISLNIHVEVCGCGSALARKMTSRRTYAK